jgi:predicted nucleotidyltransferase
MKLDFNNITKAVLDLYPDTEAIYVFGSYADSSYRPDSDVDIAILANELQPKEMWNLKGDISKKVNKDVDLVSLNSVGMVLQYEILWKGIRIYEKDAESIAMKEMRILSLCNEYLEQTQELAEEIVRSEKVYG